MSEFTVLTYMVTELVPYLMFAAGGWLALRLVRAYERRGVAPRRLRALAERVQRLELALDRVEASASDAAEAQRFTMRLVAARTLPDLSGDGAPR